MALFSTGLRLQGQRDTQTCYRAGKRSTVGKAARKDPRVPRIFNDMDLDKVIAELMRERDLLDRAIAHLEKLSSGIYGGTSSRTPEPERRPLRARHAGASSE